MILDDAPEIDQLAIQVVDDFVLARGLFKQDPRCPAEGLAIADVFWDHWDDAFGQAGLSAKVRYWTIHRLILSVRFRAFLHKP